MPTNWCWSWRCRGCGALVTSRATTKERETLPVYGEPIYGADLERVEYCLECRLAGNKR